MTMKSILTVITLAFTFGSALAQNSVQLEIIHKLNGSDFDFQQAAVTPDGINFDIDRLQYYMSEIKVIHDGGQELIIEDYWALIDAENTPTVLQLTTDSVDSIEAITFSIGVDPDHNHLDPAGWPASHPLAPKSPSMHWGWSAGYRFVAMEGEAGEDLDQNFEIHALGDDNYFETTTAVGAVASGGIVKAVIYANYAEALRGIDVSDGVITHGDYAEAEDLLINFNEHVFTSTEPVDSIPEDTTATGMHDQFANSTLNASVFPNPMRLSGELSWQGSVEAPEVKWYDLLGQSVSVEMQNITPNGASFVLPNKGAYLVTIIDRQTGLSETIRVLSQ